MPRITGNNMLLNSRNRRRNPPGAVGVAKSSHRSHLPRHITMSDHTKLNIEHFDKQAASWDSPLKVALAKKCSDAMLQADGVKWDPASTVVVDFACGTGTVIPDAKADLGLISQGLVSHAQKVLGVDISMGMVDTYNQKAKNSALEGKMKAVCVDILTPEANIPEELRNVDVVVCSMSYHHIEDIVHTSKVLASLLKKGGHLLVVDLLEGLLPWQFIVIVDAVSHTFHNHVHLEEGQGNEERQGHAHDHGQHHDHSGHHPHHHGEHHGERIDERTDASVIHTVAHIGGLSIQTLESTFNSTRLLEEIKAKKAFSARKNEVTEKHGTEGTEFRFVIGIGRRK